MHDRGGSGNSKVTRNKAREMGAERESWMAVCALLENLNFLQQ